MLNPHLHTHLTKMFSMDIYYRPYLRHLFFSILSRNVEKKKTKKTFQTQIKMPTLRAHLNLTFQRDKMGFSKTIWQRRGLGETGHHHHALI